jgi:hypothetical protein
LANRQGANVSVSKKLQLKEGSKVKLVNGPKGFELDAPKSSSGDAVLVFAKNAAELAKFAEPALAAAREDRLSWIAYPKAGQLDTDLNRDVLWKLLDGKGVRPVRQVALDEVWSALRFRPGSIGAATARKSAGSRRSSRG